MDASDSPAPAATVAATQDTTSPLSPAQERFWFLSRSQPGGAEFNVGHAARLTGRLDADALQAALEAVVARHEVLRTTCRVESGSPRAELHARLPPEFQIEEVGPGAEPDDLRSRCQVDLRRPISLERGPLLRALLLRRDPDDHVLLLTTHHFAADGWSMRILGDEIGAHYRHALGGEAVGPLRAQYAAVVRRLQPGPDRLRELKRAWAENLSGAPPCLELPTDRPHPPHPSLRAGVVRVGFSADEWAPLRRLARQSRGSAFMVLMAGLYALAARYTGRTDLVLGTVVSLRNSVETEALLGTFANNIPLRVRIDEERGFEALLANVRDAWLSAADRLDLPFEAIVEAVRPPRDTGRAPLIQAALNYHRPLPGAGLDLPGVRAETLELDAEAGPFELSFDFEDDGAAIEGRLRYHVELFDPATAQRFARHFRRGLIEAARAPDAPVSSLEWIDAAERDTVLVDWNATTRSSATDGRSLVELFDEQVRAHPTRTALIGPDAELDYAGLDARVRGLAMRLAEAGAGPGTRVAIHLPRSFELVAAMLATLRTGAAWVPLDPAHPGERLRFMVEDSGAGVVVSRSGLAAGEPVGGVPTILADAPGAGPGTPDTRPAHRAAGNEPAYVVYTSGSTGRPKGVVGTHAATLNRLAWMWDAFPFATDEVACHKTVAGFVDSVWEMLGPLLAGVPAVQIPEPQVADPQRLVEVLERHRVTRIVLVPSLLQALLDHAGERMAERLGRLRLWVSSGETLPVPLARRFALALPGARLLNLYGSSEVAGDATWYDAGRLPADAASVPIGTPIANTRVYVLDPHARPQPIGVPGELHVGGSAVALGYLGHEQLTAERFVPDPFSDRPGARLFRTGDRARWLGDGNLEFLGRLDHQIKIRGHRVEPGEIESVLLGDDTLAHAVVRLRHVASEPRLVAWLVSRDPTRPPSLAALRARLRGALPAPMVPAHLVELERLPLLANGKLDEAALPVPEDATHEAPSAPPASRLERLLAEIWQEVLGCAGPIGRDDDFFDLGGHSLMAVALLDQIESALGREVPLALLFDAPTVAGLAAAIHLLDTRPRCPMLPVRTSGSRAPLFFVPSGRGAFEREEVNILGLRRLAHGLGSDQPIYAFCLDRSDFTAGHAWTLAGLAERFATRLREIQPHGPYRLGGYSFGGRLAFDAARLLIDAGQRVELVALVDTFGPGFPRRASWLSWRRWRGPLARAWARAAARRDEGEARPDGPAAYADLARLLQAGGYRPGQLDAPVTLFRSPRRGYDENGSNWDAWDNGWSGWCTGVDVVPIDLSHESLLSEDGIAQLAPVLRERLER